jgi:hypothetical protein
MDCLSLRGGSDQIAAIWPRRLFGPAATHGNTLTLSYVRWRHHPPLKPTADDCVARVSAILSAEGAPLDITRGSDKNPILWPLDVPSVRWSKFETGAFKKKKKKKTKEERLLGMFRISDVVETFFHRFLEGNWKLPVTCPSVTAIRRDIFFSSVSSRRSWFVPTGRIVVENVVAAGDESSDLATLGHSPPKKNCHQTRTFLENVPWLVLLVSLPSALGDCRAIYGLKYRSRVSRNNRTENAAKVELLERLRYFSYATSCC